MGDGGEAGTGAHSKILVQLRNWDGNDYNI